MRELIAELATAHGGDVALAEDMVAAAADSGAHTVKIQSYTLSRLNPKDPQADWLRQAHLDVKAHERIIRACERHHVQFLSTPSDAKALALLRRLGRLRFKIASPHRTAEWWMPRADEEFIVSAAWGERSDPHCRRPTLITTVPLYPTPLECVYRADLLQGWSDHTIGTEACCHMISRGATIVEAHFCLPGRSRQMPWDKNPSEFREIRDWADKVETMTTGVSHVFRERWSA